MKQTEKDQLHRYERIAPLYDLLDFPFEYGRYRKIRPLVFEGLAGRILDAGVGTGRNMPFYPTNAHVVGVDLSPSMLQRAERRIARSPASVQLVEMNVDHLDFADASFDAAVATFLLCTLPEEIQTSALKELGRVVKPEGKIRLLEFVRRQRNDRGVMTKILEPCIAWAFGASFGNETERYIEEAGLNLVASRIVVADMIRLIEVEPSV